MENLIELNKNEIHLINGGHDGTAYNIGESVGGFFRDLADAAIINRLSKVKFLKGIFK